MYSSGVIAAIFCGYLIWKTSFGNDMELRAHSVRVWGLRAPLGVFVAAWGGLGVLYDAVFDNWWHNAYGLDVRFTSPPHLLFSLSLWFELLGSLMLVLSYLNRAAAEPNLNAKRLQRIVLYMGALIVTAQLFACFGYTFDLRLHSTVAYLSVGIFLPVSLSLMARVTQHRWACTIVTAIYSVILIGLVLLLPLIPATPRLGPIYIPVTHFIPPRFPLLVIVPAFALDLFWQHSDRMNAALKALLSGALFMTVFVAVEWPFADFLLSTASDNRFFGTRYLGFDDLTAPLTSSFWQFQSPEHGVHLLAGLCASALIASAGLYVGEVAGRWMATVRR
jgi:hypothetical protein